MKSIEAHRRYNIIVFIVAFLLAVVALGAASFLIHQSNQKSSENLPHQAQVCVDVLRKQGVNVKIDTSSGNINVMRDGVGNLEFVVNQVSQGLAFCQDYQIEAFCAGEGCDRSGLYMRLKPDA